jgi:hypothetical protein
MADIAFDASGKVTGSPLVAATTDGTRHVQHMWLGPAEVTPRSFSYTTAQTDTVLATPAAGTKLVLCGVAVMCDQDNSQKVTFRLGMASSGGSVEAFSGTAATKTPCGHPGLAAGSGYWAPPGAVYAVGAADDRVKFTCTTPGGAIYVTVWVREIP